MTNIQDDGMKYLPPEMEKKDLLTGNCMLKYYLLDISIIDKEAIDGRDIYLPFISMIFLL
jgi:hypothetical protein